MRPNKDKRGTPNFFDIDIVKTENEVELTQLEDRNSYVNILLKTIDAGSCRGELIYEYKVIVLT